jgi:hypothetical protein
MMSISNTYDKIAAYFRVHNIFDGLVYILLITYRKGDL